MPYMTEGLASVWAKSSSTDKRALVCEVAGGPGSPALKKTRVLQGPPSSNMAHQSWLAGHSEASDCASEGVGVLACSVSFIAACPRKVREQASAQLITSGTSWSKASSTRRVQMLNKPCSMKRKLLSAAIGCLQVCTDSEQHPLPQ